MRTLKRLYHNCSGFSLIEAIITIVIVGIVIVPISMVFMGSLQKATDAKEQLKSNQIAQLYIENMKAKSYDELIDFFTNGGVNVDDKDRTISESSFSTNDYYFGFPKLPAGYEVDLSYDETIYSGYSVAQNSNVVTDFDVRIDLDYDSMLSDPHIMKVYNGDNILKDQFNADLDPLNLGPLDLGFDVTINATNIVIKQSIPNNLWNTTVLKVKGNNNIKINCSAEKNEYNDVTFSVKNDTNITSTVFIVREDENKVYPMFTNVEGPLVINNNVSESSSSPNSIIKIEVAVKKNGKTTTVTASKTYE